MVETQKKPKVGIVLGSATDEPVAAKVVETLRKLEVPYSVNTISAHRNPKPLSAFLEQDDSAVYIGIAGVAAHLPGAIASQKPHTLVIGLPVAGDDIRVPLDNMIYMPPPVAVVTLADPINAAIAAAQVLAVSDEELRGRLDLLRKTKAEEAAKKGAEVDAKLNPKPTEPEHEVITGA